MTIHLIDGQTNTLADSLTVVEAGELAGVFLGKTLHP